MSVSCCSDKEGFPQTVCAEAISEGALTQKTRRSVVAKCGVLVFFLVVLVGPMKKFVRKILLQVKQKSALFLCPFAGNNKPPRNPMPRIIPAHKKEFLLEFVAIQLIIVILQYNYGNHKK